jgi:hypothetical protein
LIQLGVRAIPFGIAALVLAFVLKLPGMQADPTNTGLPAPSISVFGTIHADIFPVRVPLGSRRVQVASLDPRIGLEVIASRVDTPADSSTSACANGWSDERFAAFDPRPASLWTDNCSASFDDRFGSAMAVVVRAPSSPLDRELQSRRSDPPKPIASQARGLPLQPRKEVSLAFDDGRTAIYDITAHTVYLPSGRRLEAHSGLGSLMDNPRHVHLRMQGATPPNVYNLALRERIFHGVRAIRLNPVDDGRMHGRGGILAHTYMLGPNGQSNGCVAFRNYPEFLDAFLKGEVTRLAVVDHLESSPGKLAAGQLPEPVKAMMKSTERSRQYAVAGDRQQ